MTTCKVKPHRLSYVVKEQKRVQQYLDLGVPVDACAKATKVKVGRRRRVSKIEDEFDPFSEIFEFLK